MMAAIHVGPEIHPLPIRRPRRRHAVPVWPHLPAGRAAIQGYHAAGLEDRIHFHYQSPLMIWRGVGEMRHGTFMGRKIDLSIFRTVVSCRDNSHVNAPTVL